jgi:hypothetical protein
MESRGAWVANKRAILVICCAAAVYTVLALQWSFRAGRLAMDPVADDVSYLTDGLIRFNIFHSDGPWALIRSLWSSPPHSPWATVSAFLGFAIFGVNEWSPYALNGILVAVLLYAAYRLSRESHPINQIMILFPILLLPLTLTAVHDFRPDFAAALFTALYGLILVWLGCNRGARTNDFRNYLVVGLIVGLAYLAKPSFFPHTAVMCATAFSLAEICHRIFSPDRLQVRETLFRFGGLIIGIVLIAGPFFIVAWRDVLDYFLTHAATGPDAPIWKVPGGVLNSFQIYLVGANMTKMFGLFAPMLALWVLVGLVFSLRRKTARSTTFIVCGVLLSALSASVIALGQMNNPFFGLSWQLIFLFTAIFSLSEFTCSPAINVWALSAVVFSLCLFVLHPATMNVWTTHEDARSEKSLNRLVLERIASVAPGYWPELEPPSLFVTFFGAANGASQRWLSMKYRIPVNISDMGLSGSIKEQMSHAHASDFVEVADPKSTWLPPRLPSTALQGPILDQLRMDPTFQELPRIAGQQGTLYLFQRILPIPSKGFGKTEKGPPPHEWAIEPDAELSIPLAPNKADPVIVSLDLLSLVQRSVKITDGAGQQQTVSLSPNQACHVEMRLLSSKTPEVLRFETDTDGVKPNNRDQRTLFFDVSNVTVRAASQASHLNE